MGRKVDLSKVKGVGRILTDEEKAAEQQGAQPAPKRMGRAERVISVPVTHLYPDPDQPRMPLLPFGEEGEFIREKFITAEIDCFQAVQNWIKISKKDVGHARRLRFLRDMAAGFLDEDGGQVNPITVIHMPNSADTYQIETGEQRYWAAVLGYVEAGMKGQVPESKVVVKPVFSRKRQVLENRHVGPPTVVTQAREIAMLFISEGFMELPEEIANLHPVDRDPLAITRWVAKKRKPHDSWKTIEGIMSMSMKNMSKILSISKLPTDLLAIADRYDLSLRTLLEVTAHPENRWAELIDRAVYEGWDTDDGESANIDYSSVQPKPKKKPKPAYQKAFASVKGFVRALGSTKTAPERVIGEVANEVSTQKDEEAVSSYRYLLLLTEQVRLRLLDKGLIDE